jgi:hypothetical protein
MLIVRIAVFFVIAAIGGCFLFYLVKGDRRYLRLAGQIFRFSVILLVIVMALYMLERLILVI